MFFTTVDQYNSRHCYFYMIPSLISVRKFNGVIK